MTRDEILRLTHPSSFVFGHHKGAIRCATTGKLARYPLRRGDVARLVTSGVGGGYGDPAQRDPEAVREDVRNELLSAE